VLRPFLVWLLLRSRGWWSSVTPVSRKHINYKPLDEITKEPGEGFWEVYVDRWWSYEPDKGVLFYQKSPQCNKNEALARSVTSKYHPGAEVIFIPRAYLMHDCADYR